MTQATQRRVAIFSRDPVMRVALARAFDAAPSSWDVTLHEVLPVDADVTVAGADIADEELDPPPRSLVRIGPDADEDVIEIVRASMSQSRAVVVASAVGGCGVTTIALQLAYRAGSDALYVEVDPGPTSITAQRLDLDRIGPVPRPTRWGFSAASVDSSSCDVRATMNGWLSASPVVVIDLGRPAHLSMGDVPWIFVLPPTKLAAAATGLALRRHPGRCAVVTNRTGPGGEATRRELQVFLGCRIAVELPQCPALRDLEDEGELGLPGWSRWSRRVRPLMRIWDA
ncbi:MAG TPA: hypothetical protein VNC78_00985 [Actinomycetota bacterium]|nr:hypothetical protein [Actinomycetota bacterium]